MLYFINNERIYSNFWKCLRKEEFFLLCDVVCYSHKYVEYPDPIIPDP